MILTSIFIGPSGSGEDIELPPMVAENIASFKHHHPNLPHKLFSGEDIETFLEAKFPREVQNAYRSLKPFAYKADLARYCILQEMGGVYADLSLFSVRPLPFDGEKPVVFQDLIWSAPWDTSNSLIAAPPRHKALERAIEMVCANVERRYYGPTFLCPTGPALFGQAVAGTCAAEDLVVGMSGVLPRKQLSKEFPDSLLPKAGGAHCLVLCGDPPKLVAIKRKPWHVVGLAELGIADSDDYAARWKNRDVYEPD
jgi:hypothetical protein